MGGNCSGANQSPELSWTATGGSAGDIATYRLTMIDTFTGGTFLHWDVRDIPSTTTSSAAGSNPSGGTVLDNAFGTNGYGGPCPPPGSGQHTYTFTLEGFNSGGSRIANAQFSSAITA